MMTFVTILGIVVLHGMGLSLLRRRFLGTAPLDGAARAATARAAALHLSCGILACLGGWAIWPAYAGLLGVFVFYETAETVSLRYFELPLHRVAAHLPVRPGDEGAWRSALTYVAQYFPPAFALAATAMAVPATLTHFVLAGDVGGVAAPTAVLLALALPTEQPRRTDAGPRHSPVERAIAERDHEVAIGRLRYEARAEAVEIDPAAAMLTGDIVVFVNESAGADIPSGSGDGRTLAEALGHLGGRRDDWFIARNAVTNSGCTDVSIPSILTGAGSHEDIATLHRLPFLFDLAKARGYSTAFFTSSSLRWCNFDQFFAGAQIDKLHSADTQKVELVNDLAADDFMVALGAVNWIGRTSGPLLLVVNLNALHVPFQAESRYDIPADIVGRRERAAYLVQACHRLIVDALARAGRYDDAFICCVGDHGEMVGNDGSDFEVRRARLHTLSASVLTPLFVLKPSRRTPAAGVERLRANMAGLVQNADLAPTVAHLLGVRLKDGLAYCGASLFDFIPPHRIVYTVNTNQWRPWPRSAVAIARGTDRVVIDYQSTEHLCLNARDAPFTEREAAVRDALLSVAAREPITQRAISQVFKDKLKA